MVPVSARFSLHLVTPTSNVSASGAMVVRPPGAFRVEISGPIGPPAVVLATNGVGLGALLTGKNTFYSAENAEGALRALTGEAAGLDLVTALLLGQFVEPGAGLVASGPLAGESAAGPTFVWTWCTASGSCLAEGLSMATGRLVGVQARGADGKVLLDATLTPGSDLPWPEGLDVDLPSLGTHATAAFHSWTPATPPDAAFTLLPPPDAVVLSFPPKAPAEP